MCIPSTEVEWVLLSGLRAMHGQPCEVPRGGTETWEVPGQGEQGADVLAVSLCAPPSAGSCTVSMMVAHRWNGPGAVFSTRGKPSRFLGCVLKSSLWAGWPGRLVPAVLETEGCGRVGRGTSVE